MAGNKPQASERGEPRPSSQRDSQKGSVTVQRSERFRGAKKRGEKQIVKERERHTQGTVEEDKYVEKNYNKCIRTTGMSDLVYICPLKDDLNFI